jgi:ribosomal-protein-alanine N-acetyltransferase
MVLEDVLRLGYARLVTSTRSTAPISEPITSERLEMPLLSERNLERLADGDPGAVATDLDAQLSPEWAAEVRRLAGFRLRQVRESPTDAPWLLRPILLRESRVAAGYINFHAAPDERGVPEIGYTVLPAYRRRGYATEAVRALFDWAAREHGVRRFRASVSPDNEASLGLIDKLGFTQIGDQWDEEDGLELVFEADWPPAGAGSLQAG